MLRIGLTGGIGCGKTTVSSLFRNLGVTVIDADEISRELTQPGGAALLPIREAFGLSVFHPDGTLDRSTLRERVFAAPDERRKLERILHPVIYAEMDRRAVRATSPYVVLCVPLLLETGRSGWVDRILVIDAPPDVQKQRLLRRDGISDMLREKILASQISRQSRLDRADDVIANSGSLEELQRQVEEAHRRYLVLAEDTPVD